MTLFSWSRRSRRSLKNELSEKTLGEIEERVEFAAKSDKALDARRYLAHAKIWSQDKSSRLGEIWSNWILAYERLNGAAPPPAVKEPIEDDDLRRRCRFLRGVRNVAALADLCVGYFAGPIWINAPVLWAHLIGVLIAAFTTGILMVVWGLAPRDPATPVPAQRRLGLWLWAVGITASLLVGSVTLDRFLDLPAWLLKLQFGATCVTLSLLAAGAHVLASEVDALNRMAREYRVVRVVYRRVLILIDQMESVLEPQELEKALVLEQTLEKAGRKEPVHAS